MRHEGLRIPPPASAPTRSRLLTAPEGRFLAGGQSLLPVLKLELAEPSDLVSLAGLAELHGIRLRERS